MDNEDVVKRSTLVCIDDADAEEEDAQQWPTEANRGLSHTRCSKAFNRS